MAKFKYNLMALVYLLFKKWYIFLKFIVLFYIAPLNLIILLFPCLCVNIKDFPLSLTTIFK